MAVMLGGSALTSTPRAFAQQPTDEVDERTSNDRRAEELFLLGDSLYEQGRYAAAITTFQEAFRLSGRHLLLYNIANAQERAGRWADAVATLRTYFDYAPVSERPAIESRIERLEERIAEREAANLIAEPEVVPIVPTAEEAAVTNEAEEPVESEGGVPILGVSLTIGGAALVLTGVGLGVGSLLQRNEAEDLCTSVGGSMICPGEARDALDRSQSLAIAADVMLAFGLVATALGVYFWVSDDDEDQREVAFTPLRGGGALRFGGSF